MSALPIEKKYYSVSEYLALETEIRYEYFDGEIVAMAGASIPHNRLTLKTAFALEKRIGKKCNVLASDAKVEIIENRKYVYPDVVLTCDSEDIENQKFIKRPKLIIEVLSESTQNYDKSEKWLLYQTLPDLQYYVLISQYEYLVEVYEKIDNTPFWKYGKLEGLESILSLEKLGLEIPLNEIYENVILSEKENKGHNGIFDS